jgi:hypothetical protein
MENIVFDMSLIIGITLGLTQAIKMLGLPSRFSALISLVIGVGVAFLAITTEPTNTKILLGILCGLSASGLYSGTKAVIGQ